MEVIAGPAQFDVELSEHGCRYKFNYSQVYWNSRLGTEHQRVANLFTKTDIVVDMFAGVGPFAIPAAMKIKCKVYANDLNPHSYKYLVQNAKLNKCEKLIECSNLDGREFVKKLVQDGIKFDHVIMNLPASAVEFLDVFVNLFPADFGKLPTIHCYTFLNKEEQPEEEAKKAVYQMLGTDQVVFTEIFDVRNIAPKKNMYCISFKMPASVAYLQSDSKRKSQEISEQEEKKARLE
jgi:tRNA (guanine37-N1)-methyltransferase